MRQRFESLVTFVVTDSWPQLMGIGEVPPARSQIIVIVGKLRPDVIRFLIPNVFQCNKLSGPFLSIGTRLRDSATGLTS